MEYLESISVEGARNLFDAEKGLFRGESVTSDQLAINRLLFTLKRDMFSGQPTSDKDQVRNQVLEVISAYRSGKASEKNKSISDLISDTTDEGDVDSKKQRTLKWVVGLFDKYQPQMVDLKHLNELITVSKDYFLGELGEGISSFKKQAAKDHYSFRSINLAVSTYLSLMRGHVRKKYRFTFTNSDVNFSFKNMKKEVILLPSSEIKKVLSMKETPEGIPRAVLSCMKVIFLTGQRIGDITSKVSKGSFVEQSDGKTYIVFSSDKNNRPLNIKISREMYDEFMDLDDSDIGFHSASELNRYIRVFFKETYPEGEKEKPLNVLTSEGTYVTVMKKFNDEVTSNVLRKSVINAMFDAGHSLSNISKWCGDTPEVLSKNYIMDFSEETISVESGLTM